MINEIWIIFEDREYKLLSVEQRKFKKWFLITEQKEFSIDKSISFKIKCSECERFSYIKYFYKEFINDKKCLCTKCQKKGERNPFYGKTFKPEILDKIKKSCGEASKKLWKNKEYRNKVIKNSSKPRHKNFKKEQSERIIKWFKDNPIQRELRRKSISNSWKTGKLTAHNISESKGEIELFNYLKENLNEFKVLRNQHIIDEEDYKNIFPDILIENKIIVEYYGDYWHGNPNKYKEDDSFGNSTMRDVWENNTKRIDRLEKMGYYVFIVWESDDYENSNIINDIRDLLIEEIKNEI